MSFKFELEIISDQIVQLRHLQNDHRQLVRVYRHFLSTELLVTHWDMQLTEGMISFVRPDGLVSQDVVSRLEDQIQPWLQELDWDQPPEVNEHEFEVHFGGQSGIDLARLAADCQLNENDWVHQFCSSGFEVAFNGFLPGFSYLTGLPARFHAPRLAQPRKFVPAGSLAIAAHYCAIYPTDSPGGWNLVGRVERRVFNAEQEPPSLMLPGDWVTFRPAS